MSTDREDFEALFRLAGIEVSNWHELPNCYWPAHYAELRAAHPWWLAMTPFGAIKIGWRKRVLSISWQDTKVRAIVTKDDVTKEDWLVHAWSLPKALEYLTALRALASGLPQQEKPQ